jgi:hypothetical protein
MVGMNHPDFAVLTVSWELALRADGYADYTVKAYQNAVRSVAGKASRRSGPRHNVTAGQQARRDGAVLRRFRRLR